MFTTPACKHSACLDSMLLYKVQGSNVSMHAMLEYMCNRPASPMGCLRSTSSHRRERHWVARPTSTLCHRCVKAGKPPKAGFPASYIIISLQLYSWYTSVVYSIVYLIASPELSHTCHCEFSIQESMVRGYMYSQQLLIVPYFHFATTMHNWNYYIIVRRLTYFSTVVTIYKLVFQRIGLDSSKTCTRTYFILTLHTLH